MSDKDPNNAPSTPGRRSRAVEEDTGGFRMYPVIIGMLVVCMVFAVISESFDDVVYDVDVSDVKDMVGKEIKVAGIVVDQSLRGDADRLEFIFDIEGEGATVGVEYHRLLPDPFAYGREVIVEGEVLEGNRIYARNLTVKCPSRYQDGFSEEEVMEQYRTTPPAPEPSASIRPSAIQ
jgi:cytochrome c-type biogenesis protein CcmE